MKIVRVAAAFLVSVVVTVVFASVFYTQQVLAEQAAIGANYTAAQTQTAYLQNLTGLAPSYGLVIAVGLLIAFTIATLLKRVLTPLAPIAYTLAGAAAVFTAVYLIENVMAAGGAGALAGARGAIGLSLQCLAGAIGGFVFALTVGRGFAAR